MGFKIINLCTYMHHHHHVLSRQCLIQFFCVSIARSLRSLSEQKGPRLHSCRRCCIVWFGLPHGHSLPHLWRLLAVLPTLALALFSVTQSFLGRSVPLGSSSLGAWMALLSWLYHSVHLSTRCCGRCSGSRLSAVMKLLLDVSRLLGVM